MADTDFSAVDYVIFGLMLLISAGIGIFYGCFGKKATTSKELLVANRQMTLFPTAMSLLASFMSGITILGNPAESYNYGTMFWWTSVAYVFVVIVTAKLFIPMYVDLDITSGYEYLEKRFNKPVKLLASCIFMVQMSIYMALVLYAPALALNQVTGINIWILVVSITSVCTFYTTIGGMKGVMWTDVFQIVIMLVGLLSALIVGIRDLGGVGKIVEINWVNDRIEFFDFRPDPTVRHTVWSVCIGLFFQWLSIYAVNQSQVQRYLSVPSKKIAKRALYYNLLGLIAILSLTLFIGLVIFAKYKDCDPILSGQVKTSEQLFPLFVVQTLKSTFGLPGLFLACLFSAALSTISSGLNSLAAVFLDVLKGTLIKKPMTHKFETRLSKGLCIGFGALCLVLTYLVSFLGSLLQAALSLFGVIGGPVLGLFCLGMFIPFANSKGAMVGTISSLCITIWIFIGFNVFKITYPKKPFSIAGCNETLSNFTTVSPMFTSTAPIYLNNIVEEKSGIEKFHSISYTWYGTIAVIVVCLVGSVVSLLTGRTKPGETDAHLMISITDHIPFLSTKIKRFLHFGYKFKHDDLLDEEEEEERARKSNAVHPVVDEPKPQTSQDIELNKFDNTEIETAQKEKQADL